MKSICQLKGISGTGKGTRVLQLVMYLMGRHVWKFELGFWQGKVFVSGIHFPEIEVFIIGRFVKSNKTGRLISLTGLDGITSSLGHDAVDKLLTLYKNNHILMEGYPGTLVNRYKIPRFQEWGCSRIKLEYYIYDDFEEMQERVIGRSGKRIKGTSWRDNARLVQEYAQQCEYGVGVVSRHAWHEPVWDFGWRWMEWANIPFDLATYKMQPAVLRHHTQPSANYLMLEELLKKQTRELKEYDFLAI